MKEPLIVMGIISVLVFGLVFGLVPIAYESEKKYEAEIINVYSIGGGFLNSGKVYTVFRFKDGSIRKFMGVQGKEGETYLIRKLYSKRIWE